MTTTLKLWLGIGIIAVLTGWGLWPQVAMAAPLSQSSVNADALTAEPLTADANGRVRLLVKWQPEMQISAQPLTVTGFDMQPIAPLGWQAVEVDAAAAGQLVAELQANPSVEAITPDYPLELAFVPDDPSYSDGSQWALEKIGANIAWEFSSGAAITVAVVDSGIDTNHPELADRLLTGYNYFGDNADTSDGCGHGTHVAGIVAASANNAIGVAGVAYNALLLPVKVIDDTCVGSYSRLMRGILYAVEQGARIIVITSGGAFDHEGVQDALIYAREHGVLVVSAAGNRASATPFYPGSFEESFTVAGTDPDDAQYIQSNFGNQIDVAAPAVRIYSTYYSEEAGSTYAYMTGTSMAAPHVAGLAALILSIDPELPLADLENVLRQTADDLGATGRDPIFGYGRINAWRAVAALTPATGNVKPGHVRIPVLAAFDGATVSAEAADAGIRLEWTVDSAAGEPADEQAVVIYRSEVPVFATALDVTEITLVADSVDAYSYLDKNVKTGKSYTYWLIQTDGEVEMAMSAPVTAQASATQPTANQQMFIPMVQRGS